MTRPHQGHPSINKSALEAALLPCPFCGDPMELQHTVIRHTEYVADCPISKMSMDSLYRDRWTLPLSPELHRAQHDAGDERLFWARHGIDPLRVSLALFGVTGDDEQAELILSAARAAARSLTKDTHL